MNNSSGDWRINASPSPGRIRNQRAMPQWMMHSNTGRLGPPPPPPPGEALPTNTKPAVRTTNRSLEPDYEIIEFPQENYVNAKLNPSPKASNHCGLCGAPGAGVRCADCDGRWFCASCDDMYHRHPKRTAHVRQSTISAKENATLRPPLPPKGVPAAPVPPPRRNKVILRNNKGSGKASGLEAPPIGAPPTPAVDRRLLDRPLPATPISNHTLSTPQPERRGSPHLNFDETWKMQQRTQARSPSQASTAPTPAPFRTPHTLHNTQMQPLSEDEGIRDWESPTFDMSDSSDHRRGVGGPGVMTLHRRTPLPRSPMRKAGFSASVFDLNSVNDVPPHFQQQMTPMQQAQSMAHLSCMNCQHQQHPWGPGPGSMAWGAPYGSNVSLNMQGSHPHPHMWMNPWMGHMPTMPMYPAALPPQHNGGNRSHSRATSRAVSPTASVRSRRSRASHHRGRGRLPDNDYDDEEEDDDSGPGPSSWRRDSLRSSVSTNRSSRFPRHYPPRDAPSAPRERASNTPQMRRKMSTSVDNETDSYQIDRRPSLASERKSVYDSDELHRAKITTSKAKSGRRDTDLDSTDIETELEDDDANAENLSDPNAGSIDEKLDAPPPPVPNTQWQCEYCTYVNEAGIRVCDICCKTPTTAPAPAPVPLQPKRPTSRNDTRNTGTSLINNRNIEKRKTDTGIKEQQPRQVIKANSNKDSIADNLKINCIVDSKTQMELESRGETQAKSNPFVKKDYNANNVTSDSCMQTQTSGVEYEIVSTATMQPNISEPVNTLGVKRVKKKTDVQKVSTGCGPSPPREIAEVQKDNQNAVNVDINVATLTDQEENRRGTTSTGTSPLPQSISTQTYDTLDHVKEIAAASSTADESKTTSSNRNRRKNSRTSRRAGSLHALALSGNISKSDRSHSRHSFSSDTRSIPSTRESSPVYYPEEHYQGMQSSRGREEELRNFGPGHLNHIGAGRLGQLGTGQLAHNRAGQLGHLGAPRSRSNSLLPQGSRHRSYADLEHDVYRDDYWRPRRQVSPYERYMYPELRYEPGSKAESQPNIAQALTIEDVTQRRQSESMKSQGMELVKLLREAEQNNFTAEEVHAAMSNCGDKEPIQWLKDNWRSMTETVQTVATNYGREDTTGGRTVGTLSLQEATLALRRHKGNVWQAVTQCVQDRQKKFNDLNSRGKFSHDDILTCLTAYDGDVEAAFLELSKNQLKPFLMKIWGPPSGAENNSGNVMMGMGDAGGAGSSTPWGVSQITDSLQKHNMQGNENYHEGVGNQDYNKAQADQWKLAKETNNEAARSVSQNELDAIHQSQLRHQVNQSISHEFKSNFTVTQTASDTQESKDLTRSRITQDQLNINEPMKLKKLNESESNDGLKIVHNQFNNTVTSYPELKMQTQPEASATVIDTGLELNEIDFLNVYNELTTSSPTNIGREAAKPIHTATIQLVNTIWEQNDNVLPDIVHPEITDNVNVNFIENNLTGQANFSEILVLVNNDKVVQLSNLKTDSEISQNKNNDVIHDVQVKPNSTQHTKTKKDSNMSTQISDEREAVLSPVARDKLPNLDNKSYLNDGARSTQLSDIVNDTQKIIQQMKEEINSDIATISGMDSDEDTDTSNSPESNNYSEYTEASETESGTEFEEEIEQEEDFEHSDEIQESVTSSDDTAQFEEALDRPEEAIDTQQAETSIQALDSIVKSLQDFTVVQRSENIAVDLKEVRNDETYPRENVDIIVSPNVETVFKTPIRLATPEDTEDIESDEIHEVNNNIFINKMEHESNNPNEQHSIVKDVTNIVQITMEDSPEMYTEITTTSVKYPDDHQHLSFRKTESNKSYKIASNVKKSIEQLNETDKLSANKAIKSNTSKTIPRVITSKVPIRKNSFSKRVSTLNTPKAVPFGYIQSGHVKKVHTMLNKTEYRPKIPVPVKQKSISKEKSKPSSLLNIKPMPKNIKTIQVDTSTENNNTLRPYFLETCLSDDYMTESDRDDGGARPQPKRLPPPEPKPTHPEEERLPITSIKVNGKIVDLTSIHLKEGSPERQVRMLVAEGATGSWERAEVAVQLVQMHFPAPAALRAANECATADLTAALAYLQQECELCTENFPMYEMISMLQCEHRCCKECAKNYYTTQITDRSIFDCTCPFCKLPELHDQEEDDILEYFSNLDIMLKHILDENVHELFQRKLRDRTLMKDPNFKWCVQCSSGFFAHPKQRKLVCPDCRSITCAQCRKPWENQHDGISCELYAQWKDSNDPENQIAAVNKHLQDNGIDCPKCKFRYALSRGGCMHFTCSQCKYEFCCGCGKPFMMGAKCGLSEYCAKLGLHSHHPRNCLFYLRDKEPEQLQNLLKMHNIEFRTEPLQTEETAGASTSAIKRCPVQLQRETPAGLVDTVCKGDVQPHHAGLCKGHYVEYLAALARSTDPLPVMDLMEVVAELRRRGLELPERGPWDTDPIYTDMCAQIVREKIPLD